LSSFLIADTYLLITSFDSSFWFAAVAAGVLYGFLGEKAMKHQIRCAHCGRQFSRNPRVKN
jgi:hypothetical protein